ncbi:conserved Plasmodium protein, unknown function [Plasmodium ovale curtisi]|uniref:Translational activator GCN1 n=1 Tax=Plasmodium ovale curtisi TaxID=864141 RepID=A0A1A8WY54_PLAOA|nr:conserved Plasmodium protein, unknown function [Plasmodium ovale curtisi]
MEEERKNVEEVFEFIFWKKEKIKREHIHLVKNNIEFILLGNNEEEIVRLIHMLFFTKDMIYIKNNLIICLHMLSKTLNELNNETLKRNIFTYILKKVDNGIFSHLDKAFFCKKFFSFCITYEDISLDLRDIKSFFVLFTNCLEFLDSLFYSNEKVDELNSKLRIVKRGIIKKLIALFVNLCKVDNAQKGSKEAGEIKQNGEETKESVKYFLDLYAGEKIFFYTIVEAFGLFLCKDISHDYLVDRNKYIKKFSQIFLSLLNSNKEILLKINRSFKYIFQKWNDEGIFEIILNHIHRYDEIALKNTTPFYYYCELYEKRHFYNILEIIINIKKNKNIDNCNLLYFIIFYKFHMNNDNDWILKILFEENKKLNLIKFNEKIIFLKSVTYLLSSNKKDEIKDIIIANKEMIISCLKNDLNEDVQLEALTFVRSICSVLKNDRDIYTYFSNYVFEIMEKYGKSNDKFLYISLLYYIDSIHVMQVNEKLLTTFKSHLNLCLTKAILKYLYGTNLFLFLFIKKIYPSITSLNNIISQTLLKSIYNDKEIFYLYNMNEIKKIPPNKFFFYLYSLLLILQEMFNEDRKIICHYVNNLNAQFLNYISFDQIGSSQIQHVLLGYGFKDNKASAVVAQQDSKKGDHKGGAKREQHKVDSKAENARAKDSNMRDAKEDNLRMLILLLTLCMLHYLQEKRYDKEDLKKKNHKSFENYLVSLKKGGIINEHSFEYQNYVDDFDMLLDVLLMQKEIYQLILYAFYVYLYLYWSKPAFENNNAYVLKKYLLFLLSYVKKVEMSLNERENSYTLLLLCFCHKKIFYKNMRNCVQRRRTKNRVSEQILNHVNMDIITSFILKGSNCYDNELHMDACFHLIETFYILENVTASEDALSYQQEVEADYSYCEKKDFFDQRENGKSVCFYVSPSNKMKNNLLGDLHCDRPQLSVINNAVLKNKLTLFTSTLIDMLDEKSVENIKEEEIEICKCPYDFLYVDRNVYQPTVVVESKNIKRNRHLFSVYDEETAELIMEEELNKSKQSVNRNMSKDKKGNRGKGLTKEDIELEEIKKQNEIRRSIYEVVGKNKYILKCLKKMSYIYDIYDTKYVNILIKKIMIFLKNDLITRYTQKYLSVIIDNMISKKMLGCKNKITRCLYKISKFNKADGSALMIFSSFSMSEKISYLLTLFLFPIVLHSINFINDKDATLNIFKTLEILLYSRTQINDEDAMKCLQISFDKYPDLDIELESFFHNFNSYLLNKKNVKTLLEFCITENGKRRNVIIKSLHKYIKDRKEGKDGKTGKEEKEEKVLQKEEKKNNNFGVFKDELTNTYIHIFKHDYNKETQICCEEMISMLKIPPVSDLYKLIDSLQRECCDFQNMICKTIVSSTNKKMTKELILQLTSKYITFKECGKIGILKTVEQLAKAYYITLIDDVEFVLNFLLGLCLEEKSDITKIKEYIIACGKAVINAHNEHLLMLGKNEMRCGKDKKKERAKGKKCALRNVKGGKKADGKFAYGQSPQESFSEEDGESYSFSPPASDESSSAMLSSKRSKETSKRGDNKDLEEAFKRIYNVLNKYKDNKKSKNKSTIDLIVVMFYGCLGSSLKKESLELLNKLIEQMLHKDTDTFTQIEISNIIPKFIQNLICIEEKEEDEEEADEEEEEEGHYMRKRNGVNSNYSSGGHTSQLKSASKKKRVTFDINCEKKDSKKTKKKGNNKEDALSIIDNKTENDNEENKKNKKKSKGEKGSYSDSAIHLEDYNVSVLMEKLFFIIFNNKELKVRKGCCLLLGSVIKAHGICLLKKYNILGKINFNIHSDDITKRQSFYLAYGCLFKVLKQKFEPYILKNMRLLLECYKDSVNNIKVLGISIIEEILNDIGLYGMKRILPFIIFSLKNSNIKSKDVISYLDILHLIITKYDIISFIRNNTLVELIGLLCELVSETNAKVREICIKIFNKLEKMISNNDMKNISRQLLLCIYTPNDNHLSDFIDIFSSISFEYKIDNISQCLLFPIIKKGINNIRMEIKRKALQIFYFLIYLVNDTSLFIIYYDSIFNVLIMLLNDATPEIRYLTAKSVGNISQFLDINKKLYYIQYLFNILINTNSSVEKSGVSLCLSSILSKCSENIANNFISKIIHLIDVKKYVQKKDKLGNRLKKKQDAKKKSIKNAKKVNKKGGKNTNKLISKEAKNLFYFTDEEEEDVLFEREEGEEEGTYFFEDSEEEDATGPRKNREEEEEDEDDEEGDEDGEEEDDDGEEEDDDSAMHSEDETNGSGDDESEDEISLELDEDDFDECDEEEAEMKRKYYEEEDMEEEMSEEEDEQDEITEEDSDSDYNLLGKNNDRKGDLLNGYYLIEKSDNNGYRIKIDDDLINWKLIYDKKVIKIINSKEGLIGFFIYMPECEPVYTEKFLKKIFQKLMLCLNDSNEKIRDITLRACKVLISVYAKNNTSLILKFIENKIYSTYWRIRKDSVLLLNMLIEKNLEINKEEKDIGSLDVLHERFYFMLSLICIMKNDKNVNVRQTAYNIYKNFVNKRILQDMWPILLKKITQNLSSKNNAKQVISALTLGDLVFKMDSNSLGSILENMIKEFKTTKYTSIRKGISLGFYEIFSKNKFDNLIANYIHDIIYMIKELAYHKNTADVIKLLSLLLINIDKSILKNIINDIVSGVIHTTSNKNSVKSFTAKELISFKSIKIFLNVHTDIVIDFIVDKALIPPYNAAKLKLLSYISHAKLSTYTHLFTRIVNIFISLIFSSLRDNPQKGYYLRNYLSVEMYSKEQTSEEIASPDDKNQGDYEKGVNKVDDEAGKGDNHDLPPNVEAAIEGNSSPWGQTCCMEFEDVVICLREFLRNISERNIDALAEILFAELKKYNSKIDLSYNIIEKYKYKEENEEASMEEINFVKNYSIIVDDEKLNELKTFEYVKVYAKMREIILSVFKFFFDILNEGDISQPGSENQMSECESTTDQTKSIMYRKKNRISKKINMLNVYRIENYITVLSNYALVDINKNVLCMGAIIYMYLTELIKKIDGSQNFVHTFHSIMNKYTTDSNFNEIPDDTYEIVGLNMNQKLFTVLITTFTNVILSSTNSDIKIKAIDIVRKLYLYTNTEVSNTLILKTSGVLIRVLTNKYIEQAKVNIFSTFDVLIKKGSNFIKPLIPQLQTCIIKSLNNDKLKNQIIHILNTISEKKLSRADLLVNDLLNNINIQFNLQQSITILMILSNILNTPDFNVKNAMNKIINLIKTLFTHHNKEISFYSCKIYILLVVLHLPNKRLYLEPILTEKSVLDITTYHFLLHLSAINNIYDILAKESLLDNFKQLYVQMMNDDKSSLQNISYHIFYNLSKQDEDSAVFIYNYINYLKLPPLIMISIEIHRFYFKGLKNIFKKHPDIYRENVSNFLFILDNVLLALSSAVHAFKLLGESCAKYLLEMNDENAYNVKMEFLKDIMEDKKYEHLVEHVNGVLAKNRNETTDTE